MHRKSSDLVYHHAVLPQNGRLVRPEMLSRIRTPKDDSSCGRYVLPPAKLIGQRRQDSRSFLVFALNVTTSCGTIDGQARYHIHTCPDRGDCMIPFSIYTTCCLSSCLLHSSYFLSFPSTCRALICIKSTSSPAYSYRAQRM